MTRDLKSSPVHASAVAFAGRGLLILGRSGAGKSALALDLISRGAMLIADDQVILTPKGGQVIASCPQTLSGRIEARMLGILAAEMAQPTQIAHAVDLDTQAKDRLPAPATITVLGQPIDLIVGGDVPHLAQGLMALLANGRAP